MDELTATGRSLCESVGVSTRSPMDAPQPSIDGLVHNAKGCSKLLEGFVPQESKEELLEWSFVMDIDSFLVLSQW